MVPKSEVEWLAWLRASLVRRGRELDLLDPHAALPKLGVGSLEVTQLAAELSSLRGATVSPVVFWEHPTLAGLARHLAGAPARVEHASEQGGAANEPVVIVGMSCRFPHAPNVESFWDLLAGGQSAITEVPARRWGESFSTLQATPDELARIKKGGWLDAVDRFDPYFFGISPREAISMDPQQRLALELCWEALEDAGVPPRRLVESATGVFASAIWSDYGILVDRAGAAGIDPYTVTGWHHSIIANRISHLLGLQGPSLTLDAACASALVGVHLACESLRRGECAWALVPSVSLNVLPESALGVARFGALSPRGRCSTFGAEADGYVRGEGGGAVVLKLLSRALADGDRIRARILGSAVNNDGPSAGLTAPNPKAQAALLRRAYSAAGVAPHEVAYVEAHGTGTPLGDPIEAHALGAALGASRATKLLVGSAKTNVGHLEAAAGIVGLVKATLALEHGQIPASLHSEPPSPHIDFEALRLEVPTALRGFPEGARRLVGVSAFGLGGTNAHVVLEEAGPRAAPPVASAPRASSAAATAIDAGVVFVCPGQGAQWPGMARDLLTEPVFRAVIARCEPHVKEHLGFSLLAELAGPPEASRLDRIDVSLPAIISFDLAMAALWRSRGVVPGAVLGHSTGEIAAAHIAGALDLADTMQVICAYAKHIARTSGEGRMVLVEAPWGALGERVRRLARPVYPAIWDSAEATVLAGAPADLEAAVAELVAEGLVARWVRMDVSPHCPRVDHLRADLARDLEGIRPRRSAIPLISEVTGDALPGEALGVAHWVANFAEPALFSAAVDRAIALGHRAFVDLGPHPTTRRSVEINLRHRGVAGRAFASCTSQEGSSGPLATSLATLSELGHVSPPAEGAELLVLSAKTDAALRAHTAAWEHHLAAAREPMADLAYTACAARTHHDHRWAAVGTRDDLARALAAHNRGEASLAATGRVSADREGPRVVFVFPGQGSQWLGMGRGLLRESEAFRAALTECDAVIAREAGFSVLQELEADEATSRLAEIDVVQPVLFAVEIALAAVWRDLGVHPHAVVGHSMGETAAAFVAGALSLEDAAAVICRRSRLLKRTSGRGAMLLCELTMAEAERLLVGREHALGVASSNGARSTVLAGDPAAIDEVAARLEADGVYCRRVKVDVASHSPQMEPLLAPLREVLADLAPRQATVPLFSTVRAAWTAGEALTGAYWCDNLRQPVRFADALQQLLAEGHTVFIEMSPHPILTPSVEESFAAAGVAGAALPSLRRARSEWSSLLESAAHAFVRGVALDARTLFPRGGRVVSLPAYPFERERFWLDEAPRAVRVAAAPASSHPFVGIASGAASRPTERVFECRVSVESTPSLADHRVNGDIVFPGAAYVDAALVAARRAGLHGPLEVREATFEALLSLAPGEVRALQIELDARDRAATFTISSAEVGGAWLRHAAGRVRVDDPQPPPPLAVDVTRARLTAHRDGAAHYAALGAMGIVHGPSFQGVREVWSGPGEALASVRAPAALVGAEGACDPSLLDVVLQVSIAAQPDTSALHVPVRIGRLRLHGAPPRAGWVHARARSGGATDAERLTDLVATDEAGAVWLTIEALATRAVAARADADPLADTRYEVAFEPAPSPVAALPHGTYIVVGDPDAPWVAGLRALGARCVTVTSGADFAQHGDDHFTVSPRSPYHRAEVLRAALGPEGACRALIFAEGLDAPPLTEVSPEELSRTSASAVRWAQALVRSGLRDVPRLVVLTRGALAAEGPLALAAAPLVGVCRTLAIEHPELRVGTVDLPAEGELAALVTAELAATDRELHVVLRDGARRAARLTRAPWPVGEARRATEPARGRPFALVTRRVGTLDALALEPAERPSPGPGEVVVEVRRAGVNFRDVLQALGVVRLSDGPLFLGHECAGTVAALGPGVSGLRVGDEVIALAPAACGTYAVARAELVAPKPAALGWDEAATVPIAFLTASIALEEIARLEPGERVLIHAAAGGVGLAAVQLAQAAGAEVFATAGSDAKRAMLRASGVAHAFDSRSLAFADDVERVTSGEGVDVVLNSLSGELLDASLRLLRDGGRFVEIGRRDAQEDRPIGLRPFLRNLSFRLLELKDMLERRPALVGARLRALLDRFASGALRPLPVTVFPVSRAADAFQHMAQGAHVGRIALALDDPDAQLALASVAPRVSPERWVVISGGLGGLGLSLAVDLVARGARSLALLGRSAASPAARETLRALAEQGADVRVLSVDVSRVDDVRAAIAQLARERPLGGVVHCAAVLADGMALEQTPETFARVFAPKAVGAWNLHVATAGHPLEFFVLYSSAAALTGSPGQVNYAAANAFVDALAHERRRLGLPAVSVQWGAFADVGLAAAEAVRGQRIATRGFESLSPADATTALLRLLDHDDAAELGVMAFDAAKFVEFHPALAAAPYFSKLAPRTAPSARVSATARALRETLVRAAPEARLGLLEAQLRAETATVLRCPADRVDRDTPFRSLGVDSLMSLELRNRVEARVGLPLSATVLFTYATIPALAEHLLTRFAAEEAPAAPAEPPVEPPPASLARPAPTARADRSGDEPVAVVGLSCRFPAGGDDPDTFFRALREGADGVVRLAPKRWPHGTLGDAGPETQWAGLLPDVETFDAAFFGISPREAAQLDPQHRLLLEVTWEALASAGLPPPRLARSRTGVFFGMCNGDYAQLVRRAGRTDGYTATGTLFSTASGRVSYTLGLHGPSLTLDTACSSSLMAVHLAIQSLRRGEVELALAGGVNLILDPENMSVVASLQALSPDGRCKAFDAAANGFVRGEGCGVIALKRLSDALRDGDPICAVLRGSAANQDGRSASLSAPNVLAQEAMLRAALEDAGLSASDIAYVETHGTGTALGDPIELEALRAVFGAPRRDGSPVVIGAVKSNLGHLEAAAGIAGLIKAILCLQHEQIPKNLHFEALNPRISLAGTPFEIPTRTRAWPRGPRPRRAGVSAFGLSGTNVHVIVEEAPAREPHAHPDAPVLVPLSARTPATLAALLSAFVRHLEGGSSSLVDVAHTAARGRAHGPVRVAVLARSTDELLRHLRALARLSDPSGRVEGHVPALAELARRFVAGADVDFTSLPAGSIVPLPTAAWERRRHWFDRVDVPAESSVSLVAGDLEAQVRAHVARTLGMSPQDFPLHTPFRDMGLDSVMSVTVRNALEASLGVRISANVLFRKPTVASLTEHLAEVLASDDAPPVSISGVALSSGEVFLTGATGFLGAHLLRELLARRGRVHCLVRAPDREAALRRLRSAVRHYAPGVEPDWGRVTPWLGDLGAPSLGLGDAFDALAERVTEIVHNGAMLDFILPYAGLEGPNVGGTAEVLRLARASRRARLHHVSTVGVLPEGHPDRDGHFLEVEAPDRGRELIPCGYTQTKRAAERLVLAAEDVEVSVYRPSIIAGNQRTGAWNVDDAVCRILRGCVQAGAAPDLVWGLNLIPVDFVARAIVALTARPRRIVHVANVEATPFPWIVDRLRARGHALATVPYDEWLARVEADASTNALGPLVPWMRSATPFRDVRYDVARFVEALAELDIAVPEVRDATWDVYLDAFAREDFLPAPGG